MVFTMTSHRKAYTPAFRQTMVELVRAGQSPEELAKEFEASAQTIRAWVEQADRDRETYSHGLTADEREELRCLRYEVRLLREERDILRSAAAEGAYDFGSTPRKPTDS